MLALPFLASNIGWPQWQCAHAGDKQVLFADNVMKVNRKAKLVRRVIIITDAALYILDPTFYRLKHRYALQASSSLSLSLV